MNTSPSVTNTVHLTIPYHSSTYRSPDLYMTKLIEVEISQHRVYLVEREFHDTFTSPIFS